MGSEKTTQSVETHQLKIGDLEAATGVLTVTLRAWERRYGLLVPHRTPKGHRLYSKNDIKRVKQIREWIDRGMSLPNIKRLLDGAQVTEQEQEYQQQLIVFSQGLRQKALRQQMNILFKERPLGQLLDELWPLVMNWPESAMKVSSHALFCQELQRQLTRFSWSRQQPGQQLIVVGEMSSLYRNAILAVLGQHYLVMDLGVDVEPSEVALASQVLDGAPVVCAEMTGRRKEWVYVGPFMSFSDLEALRA